MKKIKSKPNVGERWGFNTSDSHFIVEVNSSNPPSGLIIKLFTGRGWGDRIDEMLWKLDSWGKLEGQEKSNELGT